MGANQQRPCEMWVTIETNEKDQYKQLFDLGKSRFTVSSNKGFFPSYFHFYGQSKELTYSLIEDRPNQVLKLETSGSSHQQISFTKVRTNSNTKIWKLMKENEQVQLEAGDILKLGRIELQIKQLKFSNTKKSLKNLLTEIEEENSNQRQRTLINRSSYGMERSEVNSKNGHSRMKDSDLISLSPSDYYMKNSKLTEKSNSQICKFCFGTSSTSSNPLFNVCKCSGSVKLVHFQCLKSWVKSKMGRVETSHCIYYHYQPLVCEICKFTIGMQISFEGRTYSLFEAEKIHPPFARLEHTNDGKTFEILVRLEQSTSISIGRGSQNELNLNDLSISRSHCSLFYTSRKLFLKSRPSKYGTFVELSKTLELDENSPLQLLIKNHLITIQRRVQEKGFFERQCCTINNSYKIIVK